MEIPIRLFKRDLISLCKDFHREMSDDNKDNRFAVGATDSQGKEIAKIKGIINIVRTATFFGANVIIENYDCTLSSSNGIVEFVLVLAEVSDGITIVEQNILINKVDPFYGRDLEIFIANFRSHIVADWNNN